MSEAEERRPHNRIEEQERRFLPIPRWHFQTHDEALGYARRAPADPSDSSGQTNIAMHGLAGESGGGCHEDRSTMIHSTNFSHSCSSTKRDMKARVAGSAGDGQFSRLSVAGENAQLLVGGAAAHR